MLKLTRPRAALRRAHTSLRDAIWRRTREGRENVRRLRELRDRFAERRCFVIGNGPSLARTDVRLLRDEVTIASNAIFLLFDQMAYQPTFLTVEDHLVAEDRAVALNALRGSTKIFPRDLSYCLSLDEETLFVNFLRHYSPFPRFSERFETVAYWGGTVTFLNLQLAVHLGCNPIYMIGFDHNYTVPKNLSSAVITSDSDDVNHFDPSYFGKGFRWHDPAVDRMEASYREAQAFAERRGIRIENATDGGCLEVFPRVSYSSLFAESAEFGRQQRAGRV